MKILKYLGILWVLTSLLCSLEASARKRSDDHEYRKTIARKQKKEDTKQKKATKKLQKRTKKAVKENKKATIKELKKRKHSIPAPVIEAPKVHMVRIQDLANGVRKRAEKLLNEGQKYAEKGFIKFSHNKLTKPSFEEYLGLREAEKKKKSQGPTFQTYEYISNAKGSSKEKKKSKFTFPWSRN